MFENKEGQRVPNVTFRTRTDDDWKNITTDDIFAGKTVIVFSLPGAFTPTCSSSHVPRYNQLAPAFRKQGVDEIVCLSVNDAFVMYKWSLDLGVKKIKMLPDGSGDFTRRMGMLINKDHLGFGDRSWRYAMIVEDGEIVAWFEEPGINDDGSDEDPYTESTPENLLDWLRANRETVQQAA